MQPRTCPGEATRWKAPDTRRRWWSRYSGSPGGKRTRERGWAPPNPVRTGATKKSFKPSGDLHQHPRWINGLIDSNLVSFFTFCLRLWSIFMISINIGRDEEFITVHVGHCFFHCAAVIVKGSPQEVFFVSLRSLFGGPPGSRINRPLHWKSYWTTKLVHVY